MMTQHNGAVPADGRRPAARRSLAICVDDFGLHEGVNGACVSLAATGRISSVSCMVDGPAWRDGLSALRQFPEDVEVGLHLNLTEALAGSGFHRPLRRLIALACTRRLPRRTIESEVARQLQAFESDTGRPPDFIDGHQHVHQLPVVRDALLAVLDRQARADKPWLRSTVPAPRWSTPALSWGDVAKAHFIGRLGARRLVAAAEARGYRHNARFLGVYDFQGSTERYLASLQAWLSCAGDRDLLMCHPSGPGPASDPILAARRREYEVLAGPDFPRCVEVAGLVVRPLAGQFAGG